MIQHNDKLEIYVLVFATAGLFIFLTGFITYFLFVYRRKQLKNQKEKEERENQFRQEILKSQLEIQEQTLNHISQEIHDNIGQVLSYLKLNLGTIKDLHEEEKQERIEESLELVSHVISDLRDLSKSLSYETVAAKGLAGTIRTELERINKTGNLAIDFNIEGEIFPLGAQRELVLFRIFQECIHNIMKHSEANKLKISLQYSAELFKLIIQDDGIGFCPEDYSDQGGSGLRNMKNRAKLIGATISIASSSGKGCITSVKLNPSQTHISFDGQNPSGPG